MKSKLNQLWFVGQRGPGRDHTSLLKIQFTCSASRRGIGRVNTALTPTVTTEPTFTTGVVRGTSSRAKIQNGNSKVEPGVCTTHRDVRHAGRRTSWSSEVGPENLSKVEMGHTTIYTEGDGIRGVLEEGSSYQPRKESPVNVRSELEPVWSVR